MNDADVLNDAPENPLTAAELARMADELEAQDSYFLDRLDGELDALGALER